MKDLMTERQRRRSQEGDPTLGLPALVDPTPKPGMGQLDPGTVGVYARLPDAHGVLIDTRVGTVFARDNSTGNPTNSANPRWREEWTFARWPELQGGTQSMRLAFIDKRFPPTTNRNGEPTATGPTVTGVMEYNYQDLNSTTASGVRLIGLSCSQRQLFAVQGPEGLLGHLHRGWVDGQPGWVQDTWVLRANYRAPSEGRDLNLVPQPNPYSDALGFAKDMERQRPRPELWRLVDLLCCFAPTPA